MARKNKSASEQEQDVSLAAVDVGESEGSGKDVSELDELIDIEPITGIPDHVDGEGVATGGDQSGVVSTTQESEAQRQVDEFFGQTQPVGGEQVDLDRDVNVPVSNAFGPGHRLQIQGLDAPAPAIQGLPNPDSTREPVAG